MFRTFLFLCVSLWTGVIWAQDSKQDPKLQELFTSIQAVINRSVQTKCGTPEENKAPGAVVAIKFGLNQEPVLFYGGYANPECDNLEPMKPDSLFEVGSISKTVTAAAVLKYHEPPGTLNLDRSIYSILGGLSQLHGINPTATIRQLLYQTAGTARFPSNISSAQPFTGAPKVVPPKSKQTQDPSYFGFEHTEDEEYCTDNKGLKYWQPIEVVNLFSDLYFTNPGSQWVYSNGNFLLLGLLWQDFANDLGLANSQHQLFNIPLKLTNFYSPAYEEVRGEVVTGWKKDQQISQQCRKAYYSGYGTAGGMVSSSADMTEFMFQLFGTQNVLSPRTLKEMTAFMDVPNNGGIPVIDGYRWKGYGLGVIQFQFETHPDQWADIIGHGGATAFFVSTCGYIPSLDVSLGVFLNQGGYAKEMLTLVEVMDRDIAKLLWEYKQ